MTKVTIHCTAVTHSNGKQDVTRVTLPKKFVDFYNIKSGDQLLLRVLLHKKGDNHDKDNN